MTTRVPLVLGADGMPQQLQAGDSISSAVSTTSVRAVTNGENAAALPFGTPVYASSADTVKRAQANAKATSVLAGLVFDATIAAGAAGNVATIGVLVGTTAQWDAVVTGQNGGLAFNTLYFLDPANLGKLTTTPPTTVGQCNTYVGRAISTTEMELAIGLPILL